MAVGLPDYYRGIRPRYGAARLLRQTKTVVANDTTVIDIVEGRGMIYGGDLVVLPGFAQGQSEFTLFVDEKDIGSSRFDRCLERGHIEKHSYAYYLIKMDNVNFIYCVGIMPGITFEKSFQLSYTERHGTTPDVKIRVVYALI